MNVKYNYKDLSCENYYFNYCFYLLAHAARNKSASEGGGELIYKSMYIYIYMCGLLENMNDSIHKYVCARLWVGGSGGGCAFISVEIQLEYLLSLLWILPLQHNAPSVCIQRFVWRKSIAHSSKSKRWSTKLRARLHIYCYVSCLYLFISAFS